MGNNPIVYCCIKKRHPKTIAKVEITDTIFKNMFILLLLSLRSLIKLIYHISLHMKTTCKNFTAKIFTPFAVGVFFTNRSTPPIGKGALKKNGFGYHSSASNESLMSCSVVTV